MEAANRGKRSIGLNLNSEAGREVLYSLVRTADVFLTSKLRPTREKLLFDVEHLRAINPRIVYVRGSGHGVRGESADDGGFDNLDFWMRSGIAVANQPPGYPAVPGMPSGAFGDNTGAMNIVGGISAALMYRERTGQALTVDVSLLSSGMWSFSSAVALSALVGTPIKPPAPGPSPFPMIGTYPTSDGRFISLCCLQGFHYFPELCRVMEAEELLADDRFNTQRAFDANGIELYLAFERLFAQRTYSEWIDLLRSFSGQWTRVQDSVEIIDDHQVVANDYIGEMTTSTGAQVRAVQPPVQFDEKPAVLGPSPSFNAHGDEILNELGLSTDEILQLRIDGAVT
jgi:crotonobetainyl-CoA:carnitine CoA-transferase CaiB-like acyl-CoA transferase